MTCGDVRLVLDAFMDGELDLVRAVEIEDHLKTCDACSRIQRDRLALGSALRSEDLYFRAPAHLERSVRAAVEPARRSRRSGTGMPAWVGAALAAAAVAALVLLVPPIVSRPSRTDRIAQDIVSAHVRSLMPGHLTDVPSSENHTVKPWFAGKVDFSPPVIDLSAEGFALVGGRLDYSAGRSVAALVYRKGAHVINLFVWPSASSDDAGEQARVREGYNLLSWTSARTEFWAISDANPAELREFASLVRRRLAGGG